ncbi:transmembrane protein, putative (macronuclear) [Tetrahymena thermophila SB210]|uniref:Transmembrane protein, putative n=1 Tax=Tetrahymena thermophila (strain SB210) TaxID=312017 RepID=Q23AF3_TETTS|nr:transmembrane protein, putative [Tetrahymena thermophila SB210]EAR93539.2 transmembrane protein, putative [Tetrahymena thermophila SB210]|eukprot:XP_001013784.2 transmembrane protein, putative [Tetrahymena thermophila SB210]
MGILRLDIFSSEFFFNIGAFQNKRGTFLGLLLSIIAFFSVVLYSIFTFNQYFSNQINPKFRSQSFILNEKKEIPLSQDLVGFQFYYNQTTTVDAYQQQQNKTYVVYYPFFYYQDINNQVFNYINLDLVQCTDPSLQGFICIDFSNVNNYTLILDSQNNNQILSSININIYGCRDLDNVKTTIPDNCAEQSEIDDVIDAYETYFYLKLKTSQYNTTSKQIQTYYRSIYTYVQSQQYTYNTLNTQKQETEVNEGLMFQSKLTYSSPIQYNMISQYFDRQKSLKHGFGPYLQTTVQMDEIVQQIQIQYPTITEVLALINSITALIIVLRAVGRFYSQRLIKQDFFMLFFQRLYSEEYKKILKHNNLIEQDNKICFVTQTKGEEEFKDEIIENELNDKLVPNFETKFKDHVEKSQISNSKDEHSNLFSKQSDQQADEIQFKEVENKIKINFINKKKVKSKFEIRSKYPDDLASSSLSSSSQHKNTPKSLRSISWKQQNQMQNQFFSSQKVNEMKIDSNITETLDKNHLPFSNRKQLFDGNSQKYNIIEKNSQLQAIKNLIFKFKFFKSKHHLQSKGVDTAFVKNLQNEADRRLDIFEFYKDILFLKKAIAMILTPDQLAAIQQICLSQNFLNFDKRSNRSKIQFEQIKGKLNYLETQFSIMECEDLQEQYIQKFFEKQKQNNQQSEIDQRIISSIIKN